MQGYDWLRREYPFVYSEITGYGVSLFLNAYRWTGDVSYLTHAREATGFLVRLQTLAPGDLSHGAVPHGVSMPDLELRRQYYSFDAAMCLQGLLDLYDHDRTPDVLQASIAIGNWLIEHMQRPDGSFLAMYDADTGERRHRRGEFFDDFGCLHAKHAIGLLKLYRITGDRRYQDSARRVCDWVLGLQDKDGAFRATEAVRHIVSHPHCYATEGLFFAHHVLGEDRYLKAAQRAGQWLRRVQSEDGGIDIGFERRWWRLGAHLKAWLAPRRVTDATAQALRLWLIQYSLDRDPELLKACRRAADFLCRLQCQNSADQNAVGGFYFWRQHPVMFTWATMFAVHALFAHHNVHRQDGYTVLMQELF